MPRAGLTALASEEPPHGALGHRVRAAAQRLLPASAVAAAFVVGAAASWRRLGNLVIDCGHELEVPRRVLEGDALYADVHYYWGPLAPWLNAALYGIFGVHGDVLMWAGLAAAALSCLALFFLSRRLLGPWTAASVSIAFLFLCAFHGSGRVAIFNFVLPFNCSATYGMTAALWSVHLLVRHALTGRRGPLAASAVLAGLAMLTKAEIGAAVVAAHGALLFATGKAVRRNLLLHALALVVAGSGFAIASFLSRGKIWTEIRALANPASRYYIADTMGLLTVGFSLGDVALSALGLAAAAGAAALATRRGGRVGIVAAAALAFAVPAVILPDLSLRSMPIVMLAAVCWLVASRVRHASDWRGDVSTAHLIVFAFGLASVLRIPLRVGAEHYGFFLVPPVLVCLALGFRALLPDALRRPERARRAFATCAVALLAGAAVAGLRVSLPAYQAPCVDLVARRVHMCVEPAGPELAVVPLLERFPPSTRVSAVPEGAGLVFAAGLQSGADGMTQYLPMHIPDDVSDERLVAEWERSPPDLVLYTGIGYEFGYRGFGADYARKAHAWLSANYRVAARPAENFLLLSR